MDVCFANDTTHASFSEVAFTNMAVRLIVVINLLNSFIYKMPGTLSTPRHRFVQKATGPMYSLQQVNGGELDLMRKMQSLNSCGMYGAPQRTNSSSCIPRNQTRASLATDARRTSQPHSRGVTRNLQVEGVRVVPDGHILKFD